MSGLKFRFRWRMNGDEDSVVIEAPDYPTACFRLGLLHQHDFEFTKNGVPADFEIDLTKPERVE